ncbi:MAG: histidine kinase dimerization/phospho-acceptor domain-containing protein [Rhodospirillales bacterium]
MPEANIPKEIDALKAEIASLSRENDRLRAKIEDSERFYEVIGLMASEMFWQTDTAHRFTYMSPAVVEAVDVPMAQQIGKTRAELADDDLNSPRWLKHFDDIAAHRPFRNFRYSRRHRNGQIREISATGRPVFDASGTFHGYVGVAEDITNRLQTEARIKSAEDVLMTALNAIECIFTIWDKDDRLAIFNDHFLKLNEQVPEVCTVGTTFEHHVKVVAGNGMFGPGEDKDSWIENRLERHRNPRGAFEITRQNGMNILINEARLADGSTIILAADITPQKATEFALRESQQKILDFSSTAADWFWEMDFDLRYSFISVDDPAITGMTAAGQIGLTFRETRPGRINENTLRIFEEALSNREHFKDVRYSRKLTNGQELHLAISGKPIFDMTGAFAGYRGGGRNINALVKTEEALRHEKERAEQASRAKSEFLAHMSHELRTPLNAILGFSDIIREQLFGPVGNASYQEYAADIHRSGEHLLSLINDLLDLSKIEAGKFELDEEKLLLSDLVSQSERLFLHRLQQRRIRFSATISDDVSYIFADRRALAQIFFNILSNAEKFNIDGGSIIVSIYLIEGGGIQISVRDTGCGFKANEAETALAPFGRIDNPMTKETPGTGLGLPIVRALMELHGGKLGITSDTNSGAEVFLTFPPSRTVSLNT